MQKELGKFDVFKETADLLDGDGALLVTGNPPNPMTIGWGTLGIIWGRPIFQVLVRPVRYTFGLMEQASDFSVCFLSEKYRKQLAFCGTRSGRNHDKVAICGFTIEPGIRIHAPFIGESMFHYECRIVHKHRLDPATLHPDIQSRYYPQPDHHMVYYGEILGVFKQE